MMAVDSRIFGDALETALQHGDVRAGLAELDPTVLNPEAELRAAMMQSAEAIEAAAQTELAELAAAQEALDTATRRAVELAVAQSPDLASTFAELQKQIAELQTKEERLSDEELAARIRLEAFHGETAVLRAKAAEDAFNRAQEALDREVADLQDRRSAASQTSVPTRPSSAATVERELDDRDYAYQTKLAELQNARELVRETGRARMGLLLQLERLEERVRRDVVGRHFLDADIESARITLEAAQLKAVRSVAERGILPLCREWINDRIQTHRQARYRDSLEGATASGLAELPNPNYRVETLAQLRLHRMLERLPGGSIGISGPRGSGKTTLLRAFCGPERSLETRSVAPLSLMVAAPVKFDPLDFVSHVFELACRSVLPSDFELDPGKLPTAPEDGRAKRALSAATKMCVATGALAAIAGLGLAVNGIAGARVHQPVRLLLLAAAIVIATILSLAASNRHTRQAMVGITVGLTVPLGAAIVMVTSGLGPWVAVEWIVLATVLLIALAVGTELSRSSPWSRSPRGLPRSSLGIANWLVVVFVVVAVVLAAVLPHPTTPAFAVGSALLVVVVLGVPLVLTGGREQVRDWFDRQLMAAPADGTNSAVQVIGIARAAAREAVGAIGVILAATGIGLAVLGWLHHSPNVQATTGAVALCAGLVVASAAALAAETARQPFHVEQYDGPASEGSPRHRSPTLPRHLRARSHDLDTPILAYEGDSADASPSDSATASAAYDLNVHADPVDASARNTQEQAQRLESLRLLAHKQLMRIKYQQGVSSEHAAKIGLGGAAELPITLEASGSQSRSSSEQAMTLPEAVNLLRQFLGTAAELAGGFIVGIDELDKIGSPEAAEEFLNEIKAVFGIPLCYFLISVSEDAVASFERRGMPFRDVLDSTFDDVIRIDHFQLSRTEALLNSRTLDMPLPFIALCHALAGGLPRDVIRHARRLFELYDDEGDGRLPFLCRRLVEEELRARRDGGVTVLSRLANEADTGEALEWLGMDGATEPGLGSLVPAPIIAESDAPPARSVNRMVREFTSFRYFGATLVEFFSDDRSVDDLERAGKGSGVLSFEQLARARQGFTVDPQLVWNRVAGFRRAWGLSVPDPE